MEKSKEFREVFRKAQKKLDNLSQKQPVFNDITITQSNALIEIGRNPGLTIKRLSEILEKDKSSVSRLVKSMQKSEWIILVDSTKDGREKIIQLTKAGKSKFITLEESMDELFDRLVANFSPKEYEQLIQSLNLLIHASDLT